MDKVSLIIVSKADTEANTKMLEDTIRTATEYKGIEVEVIVVDNYYNSTEYKVIPQPEPFNYNGCLNAGAKVATGNFLAFANNDLYFKRDALAEMIRQMRRHRLDSASCLCPNYHKNTYAKHGVYKSYKVGIAFTGWFYMMSREAYNKLGEFRTTSNFYCSDNETVEHYKEAGIIHGLSLIHI